MNYSDYRLTLDIHDVRSNIVVKVKRGTNAKRLCIALTENGKVYEIANGCTAVFKGKKPDGYSLLNDCDIEGNTIYYVMGNNTTSAVGIVDSEVSLFGGDGEVITSPTFSILVEDTPVHEDDVIDSSDELGAFASLVNRVNDTEEAVDALEHNVEENSALIGTLNNRLNGVSTAVLFTKQTLTPEQQAQARENIGVGDYATKQFEDGDIIHADGMDADIKSVVLHGKTTTREQEGKNLCSAGTVSFTQRKVVDIDEIPPGKYIFSVIINSSDTNNDTSVVILKNGIATISSKALKRGVRSSYSFTTTQPLNRLELYAAGDYNTGDGDTCTWADIQIEDATNKTEATEYEPYGTVTVTEGISPSVTLGERTLTADTTALYDGDTLDFVSAKVYRAETDTTEAVNVSGRVEGLRGDLAVSTENTTRITYKKNTETGAVLYTVDQGLTPEQQEQARKNIGAGTGNEIEDGSITPEKTSFVEVIRVPISANLFDKDTMAQDGTMFYLADPVEGKKPAIKNTSAYSAYGGVTIPVSGLSVITLSYDSAAWGLRYYNYFFVGEDGRVISGVSSANKALNNGGLTLSVPNGAVNLLVSIANYCNTDSTICAVSLQKNLMVVDGDAAMPYAPYGWEERLSIPGLVGVDVEETPKEMRLCLPAKYDLVVGDTFELFYKGIMLCKDPYQYNILLNCDIGNAYGRKFIVTPTEENVGLHKLTVTVTDDFGTVLANKSVSLNVINKATSPAENINVLCVGDSLTEGGAWVDEMYRRLTKTTDKTQHNAAAPVGDGLSNITFVGKKTTTNGAGYEGIGGWQYDLYLNPEKASNPFAYNGAIDFNAYCADLEIDHIDQCYILLGWNMVSYSESVYKEKAKTFIDLLVAHNPNIKIVLVGIQMPFLDGLAFNYGAKGIWANYRALQEFVMNLDEWNKNLATEYANNITSINLSGQFDTEYGTWTREVAVNARNAIKRSEQYNGVHPKEEGYYQIADAVYRKFMADYQ